MKRIALALSFLLSLVGCSKQYEPLATVESVDLQKYLGKWYEIARYDHSFEKGCSNVNATYTFREDAKIKVLNQCLKDNTISKAVGKAYAVDNTNAKLKISFFGPFYGDYQILMLDEDYTYAVIGEPSREYFWILSRTPTLDKEITNMILAKLPFLGYDKTKIIWTLQEQ